MKILSFYHYTVVPAKSSAEPDIISQTVAAVLGVHVGRDVFSYQNWRQTASLVGCSCRIYYGTSVWFVYHRDFLSAFSY